MEKTYKIKICGSGFGGNIASIHVAVKFDIDTEKIEDFVDKARNASFMAGYNILHFEEINEVSGSKCFWCCHEQTKIATKILELVDKITLYNKWLEAIEKSKNTGKDVDIDDQYKSKAGFNEYTKKYQIGGFDEDSIQREIKRYGYHLAGINMALDALGFDIEDEKAKKQILTNLGFYRTDIPG